MSKRKLNRRQQWRVEKIQSEKIARAGKKADRLSATVDPGSLGDEQNGLIIAHFGQTLELEALEAPLQGQIFRCFVRANIDALVTGDRVIWRPGPDRGGVIEARLERTSLLQRPDNYNQLKPVAANIDRIVIVVAIEPEPHRNLIDRYLVAAETVGIRPALLFNKMDLLTDLNRSDIEAMMVEYTELGYEILRTSAHELGSTQDTLLPWLAQHTSILVGQSGVGKSSLIRSILGDDSIRIGALSEHTRKGTHTTTTARLFHIPDGGDIIDSPGIREFGLWHISEQELLEGFIEFRPLLGDCRFRDCRHDSEPGCALLRALESGQISTRRVHSFRRIRQSLAG
jgi:ribosome biogenesis GTPase